MKVAIIGAGINGLVAANYLRRAGVEVTIFEKKAVAGGACAAETISFNGVEYRYASGASVLGFMQNFVYRETGLAERLTAITPEHEEVVYFEGEESKCCLSEDVVERAATVRSQWGETGDVAAFHKDLEHVVEFLCQGFKNAVVPTIEDARRVLGSELTRVWITGTARDLLSKYFTSEKMRIFYAIDVVESGPVSLDSPFSAFSIALMATGTVFDGKWGFVRGRIWKLIETLIEVNNELGVRLITGTEVLEVVSEPLNVVFKRDGMPEERLQFDRVIFATDPVSASKICNQSNLIETASDKEIIGTSGKLIMFFSEPVSWKFNEENRTDFDMAFKFIISAKTLDELQASAEASLHGEDYAPAFSEIYCEGAAMRKFGDNPNHDVISVFIKHLAFGQPGRSLPAVQQKVEQQVLAFIQNQDSFLGSVLLTPRDLQSKFDFPAGNIDHIELCDKQTYFARNWSASPAENFYQFGDDERILYCAAGSYPCGSIAGTAGFMCARQLLDRLPGLQVNSVQ
jgi:phytoene dehydrogenase-like protein